MSLGTHTRSSKQTIMMVSSREASLAMTPDRIAPAAMKKKVPVAAIQNFCPGGIHLGTQLAAPAKEMKCTRPKEITQTPYKRMKIAFLPVLGESFGASELNATTPPITSENSSKKLPQESYTPGTAKIWMTQSKANTE